MVKGNKGNLSKSSEIDLHSLLEDINLAAYRTSYDGKLLYNNTAYSKMLEYTNEEELKAIPVYKHFVNKADRDHQLKVWSGDKISNSSEIQLKTKTGKIIWVQDIGRVIEGKSKNQNIYEGVFELINDRKNSERELTEYKLMVEEASGDKIDNIKNSRQIFKNLLATSPNLLSVIDREGKYIYLSQNCKKLTGYTQNELINDINMLVHRDELEKVKMALRSSFKNKKGRKNFKFKAVKKNGEIWHASASWNPIQNNFGEFRGFLLNIEDITKRVESENQRKIIEDKLKKKGEQFEKLFKSIPIPTYIWQRNKKDFILIDYNDEAEKISKGKIANYLNIKASELYKDNQQMLLELENCYSKKKVIEREMPYEFKSIGKTKYLAVKYSFVSPDQILVHTEDITERREIEKELKISEERLKLSLKGADEKIWDWNVVKGDAYFETLPGHEPGDIVDHYNSWEKLVHPDDLNKVLEILNTHLKGASDFYKAEYRIKNKAGDWIWILGKGKVVERDRNGKVLRVVGTHTDITDRVKVRLELERYKDNLEKLVEDRTRELLKKNKLLNIEINKRKSMEIALKESENNWRSLSENIPDMIVTISTDGIIKFVNKVFAYSGKSKSDIVGLNIFDYLTEEAIAITKDHINKVLKTGEFSEYEISYIDIDETTSIFRSRISPVFNEKKIVELNIITTDITERKKQEEALYKSEETFRMITEASPGAIVISGPDGKVTYASKQTLKILNYRDVNEVIGKNTIDQFAPESRILALKNWIKIKNNDLLMPIRYSMLKKDGTIFPAELTSVAVRDKDGNAEVFLSVISDITERLKMETTLKESENNWRSLSENIPDIILNISKKGEIKFVNRVLESFGFTKNDIIEKNVFDFLSKKYKIILKASILFVLKTGKFIEKVVEVKDVNGKISFFRGRLSPAFDGKKINGLIAIATDITERKKQEEELYKSKETLRMISEASPGAIVIADSEGKVTYVSKQAVKDAGYKYEGEVIGRNVVEFFAPESRPLMLENWKNIHKQQLQKPERYILLRKDGTEYPVELTAASVFDREGNLEAVLGVSNDITERLKMEIALKESESNWRSLSENIPDVIINISKDGTIKFINKVLGESAISNKDVIGESIYNFIPKGNQPILTKSIDKVLKTKKFVEYDVETKDLKGKTSIFRSRIGPIYDNKKIVGFNIISTDITERKKQEEALHKSEEMFRMIAELSPSAIAVADKKDVLLYASQEYCKIHGYKNKKEVIGKHVFDLVAPESRILANENRTNSLMKKITRNQIRTLLRKDGTTFKAEINAAIIKNKSGEPEVSIAVIRDISEQLEIENSLKNVAEEWNKTFDTINDCISVMDKNGIIFRCNLAFVKLLGLKFKDILGKSICELLHDKVINSKDCLFRDIKKLNKKEERILEIHDLLFMSIMEPIKGETGELTGVVHVLRDITDEKKKELKLREQKEFIQIAIDSLTHPFYIIDISSFKIIMKNKATDITFTDKEMFCYSKTHNLTKPCDETNQICPVSEIKRTGKPVVSEHLHISKDSSTRIFETHSFPIFDRSGKIIQIIQYSLNITDKKKAEDESEKQKENLRHADRMISLGILVSGVAHEINNPNNAIILNSSFLKRSYKDIVPILDNYYSKNKIFSIGGLNYNIFKDEINDIFTGITRGSNKIKAIVEELKQYSRKDRVVTKYEVEINLVVKSALNLLHGMIKKSTKNLKVSYEKNLPVIYGNFQNIEQVIINIIQNSCQALTSKDKSVSISTSFDKTRESIVIEVVDEGSGIDEKNLKYIKEPFYTTKRETGGVGLGLSVSLKIVEEHGGSMSFSSKLNTGTIVRVILPVPGNKNHGE